MDNGINLQIFFLKSGKHNRIQRALLHHLDLIEVLLVAIPCRGHGICKKMKYSKSVLSFTTEILLTG